MTTMLKLAGVVCRYGRLAALDGVDLHVPAGQRHAIIGPNGAGKTTLLNAVSGMTPPDRGRILLAGRDLTAAGPARRSRAGIARTFQTPAVADTLTTLENLAIGAWRHVRRWGRAAAAAGQAREHADALGIAHLADVPAGQLAHGQRRLLEIGIALAAQPRLLLLDEPAAGLAAADLPVLLAALRRLPPELTVLLVEHHMDVVTAIADQVTVLHHGTVLAQGTPEQIHTDPAVAEVYLGTLTNASTSSDGSAVIR
jgi:branched-chain amino acid transport system ATP-binding protein